MRIVRIVTCEAAQPRIADRPVVVTLDRPGIVALRLHHQNADAEQAAEIVEPDEFSRVRRDQPLVGEGEADTEQEGRHQEGEHQHHDRRRHQPSGEIVPVQRGGLR